MEKLLQSKINSIQFTNRLDDIVGNEETKEIFRESLVQPIDKPKLFEEYGLEKYNFFLLYGQHGTAKTSMA